MVHAEDDTDKPSPGNEGEPPADPAEPRKPLLGKIKTDEEARLAAEIEKLRS